MKRSSGGDGMGVYVEEGEVEEVCLVVLFGEVGDVYISGLQCMMESWSISCTPLSRLIRQSVQRVRYAIPSPSHYHFYSTSNYNTAPTHNSIFHSTLSYQNSTRKYSQSICSKDNPSFISLTFQPHFIHLSFITIQPSTSISSHSRFVRIFECEEWDNVICTSGVSR